MNKKLVVAAILVFAAAGFMLAQGTVKAQDNTDNSAMNSDSGNTDNTVAPGAPAAQ